MIDDSNRCSEPETLIPLVSSRCHQVVLLGDPQGLQPPIEGSTSQKLGLGRSLLDRYRDQAVVLNTHYRMVWKVIGFVGGWEGGGVTGVTHALHNANVGGGG